jgi:PadR family transcriptional regulator, regulatory protein PadR
MLGEFEYLIITAAAYLGENAYSAAIRDEIESATGRKCSIGALYTTVDRLEAKGLVRTWMGEATPQRGGRSKRMIQVTPEGVSAAAQFFTSVSRLTRNVSWAPHRCAMEPLTRRPRGLLPTRLLPGAAIRSIGVAGGTCR